MLMNIKQILSVANEHNFAVPAFNVGTCQMLKSIIECCEKKNAPVILAIHPKELAFQGDDAMAAIVHAANASRVPVCIHMDHSSTIEQILHAVRTGFTSVMMDASDKPFEENIRLTKQVVAIAHPLGITVEAELGTIGTTEHDTEGGTTEIIYTNPDDAVKFVEETGIDCLAIAIGTAHGIYPKGFDPHLRLDILSESQKEGLHPAGAARRLRQPGLRDRRERQARHQQDQHFLRHQGRHVSADAPDPGGRRPHPRAVRAVRGAHQGHGRGHQPQDRPV